jgi:hypothetical protein
MALFTGSVLILHNATMQVCESDAPVEEKGGLLVRLAYPPQRPCTLSVLARVAGWGLEAGFWYSSLCCICSVGGGGEG